MVRTPSIHCWGSAVQFLVGELRVFKAHGMAKKKKPKKPCCPSGEHLQVGLGTQPAAAERTAKTFFCHEGCNRPHPISASVGCEQLDEKALPQAFWVCSLGRERRGELGRGGPHGHPGDTHRHLASSTPWTLDSFLEIPTVQEQPRASGGSAD